MRARICEGLEYLGVKIDPEKNTIRGKEAIISTDDSKVTVWVIPTNEELMIAQDTAATKFCQGCSFRCYRHRSIILAKQSINKC